MEGAESDSRMFSDRRGLSEAGAALGFMRRKRSSKYFLESQATRTAEVEAHTNRTVRANRP